MNKRTALLLFLSVGVVFGASIVRGVLDKHNHQTAMQHCAMGDELEKQGRMPEAIAEMKLAIADDPAFFDARQGLSDIYESQNQIPEALAVLNEGIRISPRDDERYRYGLCEIYESKHDYPNALLQIRRCLKDVPGDENDMRMLGMLLERTKQYDEAAKCWGEYNRLHPKNLSGLRGLDRVRRLVALDKQTPTNSTVASHKDSRPQ